MAEFRRHLEALDSLRESQAWTEIEARVAQLHTHLIICPTLARDTKQSVFTTALNSIDDLRQKASAAYESGRGEKLALARTRRLDATYQPLSG